MHRCDVCQQLCDCDGDPLSRHPPEDCIHDCDQDEAENDA